MAIVRMDNVLIVVEDLERMIAFFLELGMELAGTAPVEGEWVERVIAVEGVSQEVAMLQAPGGGTKIELAKFHAPAPVVPEPQAAPSNTLGVRRVMFAVDDIADTVGRLRAHGGELVGDTVEYQGVFLLCYVRGPEGIIIGLSEEI